MPNVPTSPITTPYTGVSPSPFTPYGGSPGSLDPASASAPLGAAATGALNLGSFLTGQGFGAVQPVISYLNKLLSGDTTETGAATMPEVDQILGQYSTARRAIAGAPRGGGQASALAQSFVSEAGDISKVQAGARPQAAALLSQVGLGQEQAGTAQTATGLQSLMSLLQTAVQSQEFDQQMLSSLIGSAASGLGSYAGLIAMGMA